MIVAAALCVAVAAVHVDDQGGVTAFADPDWLGWAYRLLEVGSIVVAGALVFAAGAAADAVRARLVWLASAFVGAGPFVGYVLTRTTGLPGDSDDVGNWGETLGVVSLVVEGLLVMLAVAALVRISVLVASGVLAAGVLAACSSSASTPPAHHNSTPPTHQQTSQQPAGPGTTLRATETEFHIALSSASLKPGTYTFRVKNAGDITHALTVDGSGVDNKSTGDISPGASADLTVTLKAGKYDVYCPVGDHKMEGMDETVQVG